MASIKIKESVAELVGFISKLNRHERAELIGELLAIDEFREDLIDIAIIESRKNEPTRPFREYLKERGIKN